MKAHPIPVDQMNDEQIRELLEDDEYVRDVSPSFMAVAAITFLVMMAVIGALCVAALVWFFSRFTG